jgi:hypothetical protein
MFFFLIIYLPWNEHLAKTVYETKYLPTLLICSQYIVLLLYSLLHMIPILWDRKCMNTDLMETTCFLPEKNLTPTLITLYFLFPDIWWIEDQYIQKWNFRNNIAFIHYLYILLLYYWMILSCIKWKRYWNKGNITYTLISHFQRWYENLFVYLLVY